MCPAPLGSLSRGRQTAWNSALGTEGWRALRDRPPERGLGFGQPAGAAGGEWGRDSGRGQQAERHGVGPPGRFGSVRSAAVRLSSLARGRGACSPGDPRPRSDLRGGGPGPGVGLTQGDAERQGRVGELQALLRRLRLGQQRCQLVAQPQLGLLAPRGHGQGQCPVLRAQVGGSGLRPQQPARPGALLRAPVLPPLTHWSFTQLCPPREKSAQSGVTPPASLGHEQAGCEPCPSSYTTHTQTSPAPPG